MVSKKTIFEFYVFNKLLKKSMSTINASEVHGITTALICMQQGETKNLEFILSDLTGVKQNKKIIFNFLKQLHLYNYNQIKEINTIISLLIPNGSENLYTKIKYLKLWLKGFISGLGLFGMDKNTYNIPIIYEIVNDFSMITYADHVKQERDEIYYVNLLEYVKISIEIIYFEIYKTKQHKIT